MPTTTASFTPDTPASATFSSGAGPAFVTTATQVPSFAVTARQAAFFEVLSRSPAFDPTTAVFSVPAGARDVIAGSSILPTSGTVTLYLGIGSATSEGAVAIGVPQSTLKRVFVTRSTAPGVGGSAVYTLRRNGLDTAVAVTLGAGDTSGSSTPGVTVALDAGDEITVRLALTGAAEGIDNFVLEFQLT